MKSLSSFVSVWVIALVLLPQCVAQQVPSDPTSTHVFPAGGQRGTKVAVRVGGECLPPLTRFRIFGEGLKSQNFLGQSYLRKEIHHRDGALAKFISTIPRSGNIQSKSATTPRLGRTYGVLHVPAEARVVDLLLWATFLSTLNGNQTQVLN